MSNNTAGAQQSQVGANAIQPLPPMSSQMNTGAGDPSNTPTTASNFIQRAINIPSRSLSETKPITWKTFFTSRIMVAIITTFALFALLIIMNPPFVQKRCDGPHIYRQPPDMWKVGILGAIGFSFTYIGPTMLAWARTENLTS